MTSILFKAMGTSWWIQCDVPRLLAEAEALVHTLERRLSRFREDSALSRLNRERRARCPTLADVTRQALDLQIGTGGAFDPTLGSELAALGYDRSFDLIERRPHFSAPRREVARERTQVIVEGDLVRLEGPGELDLGGIGKGYAVDEVVSRLVALGADSVLVDGGGDLRAAGASFPIGVADGLVVETRHGAIATSSTRKRRWRCDDDRMCHHIIDPGTGLSSSSSLDTVTVIAPTAATADALATALLVAPEAVLMRLPAFAAHALVRSNDAHWWSTPGVPIAQPLPTANAEAT